MHENSEKTHFVLESALQLPLADYLHNPRKLEELLFSAGKIVAIAAITAPTTKNRDLAVEDARTPYGRFYAFTPGTLIGLMAILKSLLSANVDLINRIDNEVLKEFAAAALGVLGLHIEQSGPVDHDEINVKLRRRIADHRR